MADTTLSPHIVVVASPGIGHVTPLAEFTKLLVLRHHFAATFVTFSGDLTCSLPSSISVVKLPFPHPPTGTQIVTHMSLTIANSVAFLREILVSLRRTTRIAAVVADIFGGDFLSTAEELGIQRYLFFTTNLFALSFTLYLPTLEEITACEFREMPEPVILPGCVPLKGEDFVDALQERESEEFGLLLRHVRRYDLVDGILVNSFDALEGGAAAALKQRASGKPPIWPIGPITWTGAEMDSKELSEKCMGWLNHQSNQSVVFISFGSSGNLSWEQTQELALGLEMSGQRFLWVVRAPSDVESGSVDPLAFLPKGFLERTKERGMIVHSWAPQRVVLGHCATGGFVSHCGWNSTLESLINGVPMIAWPLYSEQRMNAVLLVEGAELALRVKVGENGVVGREEVAKVVKELMEGGEGKEVRQRMQEMKEEAAKAVGKEGSSFNSMEEVIKILKESTSV